MQFLAIVSILAATVAANPLSIPAKSLTLDAGALVTLTLSKVVTIPAFSVPSSICFTVPAIPTTTVSIPPLTLTNTIPGVTIDPKTLTNSVSIPSRSDTQLMQLLTIFPLQLPGATLTFPPSLPTGLSGLFN